MEKTLKDIILRVLEESSMTGVNVVDVVDSWWHPLKIIASIPIIPESTGAFIASKYATDYAMLIPYENCKVIEQEEVPDTSGNVRQLHRRIYIRVNHDNDKPQTTESEKTEAPEVKLIHDGNASYYMSATKLKDILRDIINGCRKNSNYCGVYIRSVLTLRLLKSFYIPTDDMTPDVVDTYWSEFARFLNDAGDLNVVAERVQERRIGTHPDLFYEIFVNDVDEQYAKTNALDGAIPDRYRIVRFILRNQGRENAFLTCQHLTLVMKNMNDELIDCVEMNL